MANRVVSSIQDNLSTTRPCGCAAGVCAVKRLGVEHGENVEETRLEPGSDKGKVDRIDCYE